MPHLEKWNLEKKDEEVKTIIENWMYLELMHPDLTLGRNNYHHCNEAQEQKVFISLRNWPKLAKDLWHLQNENGSQANSRTRT
uniref:Uncharacterized protein n=1 Tax=Arundo donax TaxID=35708 RepID=A0A0A9FWX2_ARUDO